MIGWVLFAVTLMAAVGMYLSIRRTAEAERLRLEQEQRSALERAERESEQRIGRLEREATKTRLSARDDLVADLLPALDSL